MSLATAVESNRRKISNSEVAAWLACQRKWYYAHSLNIKPKAYGETLNRGIIGHEGLAAYYAARKEPSLVTALALEEANTAVAKHLKNADTDQQKMLYKLLELNERYFAIDPFRTWRILEVEVQHDLKLTARYDYSMRLDLLAKDPSDGRIWLIDHKYVYDFWQPTAFELNAQFPKYLKVLQDNGTNVSGVIVNQLRHRVDPGKSTDEALFKQVKIIPSTIEKQRVFREHLVSSDQIMDMRDHDIEDQKELVLRNMSQTVCKTCPFTELCKTELVGQDPTLMIKTFFEPNDYGYNSTEESNV